ncbi:MAG: helix-turn-helix domain-containing protein [Acidobacteriota bacterium]
MALNLLRAVGEQTRRFGDELYAFAGRQASADRLLNVLQQLAKACGQRTADGIRLRIPFTVQDLADEIACSRQWTTRLLSELEGRRMIQRKNGWIVLMEPKAKNANR